MEAECRVRSSGEIEVTNAGSTAAGSTAAGSTAAGSTALRSALLSSLRTLARSRAGPDEAPGLGLRSIRPCKAVLDAEALAESGPSLGSARFDVSFAALSDPLRRGGLEKLTRADASITVLAERFHMTRTGMRKPIGVLEQADLVTPEKVGRVRRCTLGTRRLEEEAAWLEGCRQPWATRFDALDTVIDQRKCRGKRNGRSKGE